MGRAKSYAERLFDFPEIGALEDPEARVAIAKPVQARNVAIDDDALNLITRETHGYPYFLQEWGKHAWDTAAASPITLNDVRLASDTAVAALDESFFRVRFDRLTPGEKKYLRAMAELGPGPSKGMVWSPSHGDTAFTVPLFDQFMHRIMPGYDWLT